MRHLRLVPIAALAWTASVTQVAFGSSTSSGLVASRLSHFGFHCAEAPAPLGFHCRGHLTGYSMPVHLFFTHGFDTAAPISLAYYLHGFILSSGTSPYEGPNGDFGRFLFDSGANIVLVSPESRGRNDTYARELNTARKLETFFANAESLLRAAGVPVTEGTATLLSGHSGAYVAIGLIGEFARQGKVSRLNGLKGVALFDSAYGYREGLVALADVMCRGGGGVYLLAFNPADGSAGKKAANERIARELGQSAHSCNGLAVDFRPDPGTSHMAFPRKHMARFFSQVGF